MCTCPPGGHIQPLPDRPVPHALAVFIVSAAGATVAVPVAVVAGIIPLSQALDALLTVHAVAGLACILAHLKARRLVDDRGAL